MNRTQAFLISGATLDAFDRLLKMVPPPRSAKDRAAIAQARRIVDKARRTSVTVVEFNEPRGARKKPR